MKNVAIEIKDNKLHITIDLTQRHGTAKSGRSQVVATTEGFVDVPDHPKMWVNLTCNAKE